MESQLYLVTPLVQYQKDKNSINFIRLLNSFGSKAKIQDSDCLKDDVVSSIQINHENFRNFDQDLWRSLSKLDLAISWYKFAEDNTDILDVMGPLDEKISEIRDQVIESLKEEDRIKKELIKEEDGFLIYFAEINSLLKDKKEFEHPLKLSKELSTYLKEITYSADEKAEIQKKPYLPDQFWDWFYPIACSIYSAFLENASKDENEKRILIEAQCLNSWLCLSLIAVTKVSKQKYFEGPANNFLGNIKFFNTHFTKILCALVSDKDCEDPEKVERPISQSYAEHWLLISSIIFPTIFSSKFILSITYDVLIDSFIDDSYEIWDTEVEVILYKPIESLLYSKFLISKDDVSLTKIYKDSPNLINLIETLKEDNLVNLSVKSCKKLLNEMAFSYWDEDDPYFALEAVSKYFVEICNKSHKKNGIPYKLSLSPGKFDGHRAYPSYFESISTIGINLDQYLFSSIYDGTNATERLVAGASSISDAGLVDHALIFLGYGLVKISLGFTSNEFSIREVNKFISKPEISSRLDRTLLPFLKLCLISNVNIPLSNRIWIENILYKNKKGDLHLVDLDRAEIESFKVHNLIKIPSWFSEDDDALVKNLNDYRAIANRNNQMSEEQWNRYSIQNNIRGILYEISTSLELVSKNLFEKVYLLNKAESKFQSILKKADIDLRLEGELDLGAIDYFINRINRTNKKDPKIVKEIISVANEYDPSIGKFIFQAKDVHDGVIKSFQHFRDIDNLYISHKIDKKKPSNNVIPQSEANWLFSYAVSDFQYIYRLFY